MSIRPGLTPFAFALYAVASLVSMAAMSIAAALAGVALLAGEGARAVSRSLGEIAGQPEGRRLLRASALLSLACAASLVVAWVWPLGYGGKVIQVDFARDLAKLMYLFLPIPIAAGLRAIGERAREGVLRAWLLAFAALSAVAILQHFWGWPRPQPIPGSEPIRYHATGFLGHHLSLASIFLFPLFASLDLGLARRRWWLVSGLGIAAVFLSYARNAWISLPIGLLAWALLALPRRRALAAALVVVGLAGGIGALPPVRARLADALGVHTRIEIWEANLEFLRARPFTGAGWHHNLELSGYYLIEKHADGKPVFSGHAHNNLLDMLGGTGILGALAWVAWVWTGLAILWPSVREGRAFSRGLLAAWVAFHLNGLTQVNFWESKVLHQIAWMTAWALVWAGRGRQASSEPSPTTAIMNRSPA